MQTATGSFKGTAFGLMLVYVSIIIMVLTLFGMIAAGFVPLPVEVIYAILGGLIVGPLCSLLGRCLCLTVPRETQGRPYIAGAAALDVAAVAIRAVEYFQGVPKFLREIQSPMQLVGFVLFLLFLRKLAMFVGSPEASKRANDLIKTGLVILLIFAVGIGYSLYRVNAAPSGDPGSLGLALAFVLPGASIAMIFWLLSYVRLLSSVRKEVAALP